MKRPSFQFYPKEWVWDIALRQCSVAARGLWADLLCLMHEGEPYGHLADERGSLALEFVLRIVGIPDGEYTGLLAELESHGVFSRTEAGVVYSRRMVRDDERRTVLAANGRNGGRPSKALTGGGTRNCVPGVQPIAEPPARMTSQEEQGKLRQWAEFKALYPAHRLDEEPAARAWVSREDESEAILAGLRVWAVSLDWSKDGGDYVKWASKFIFDGIYKTKPKVAGSDKPAGPAYRKWEAPKPTE
jgi:hypothetical protein